MGSVGTFPIFPISGSFGTPILSRFPKPPKGFGTGNRSGNRNGISTYVGLIQQAIYRGGATGQAKLWNEQREGLHGNV